MKPYMVPTTGDPGLQSERTVLAWTRSALAIAVNALLSIRAGFVASEPWLANTPPAGALLGVAAAALVASAGGVASVFVGGVA